MTYRAIIFDLDGTLLNTLEDIGDATNHVLSERGFPIHDTDAYRSFIGDGAGVLIKRALPPGARDKETIRSCLDAFLKYYGAHWDVKTRPYDGIRDMLSALTARQIKMAVLSNKPDSFTRKMTKALLPDWPLDPVIGQRDGVPLKPDPAVALDVAGQLGIPPVEFIFVGDSAIDMKTAIAAGMHPVGALWGFGTVEELRDNGARALIENPLDLIENLDEMYQSRGANDLSTLGLND